MEVVIKYAALSKFTAPYIDNQNYNKNTLTMLTESLFLHVIILFLQ